MISNADIKQIRALKEKKFRSERAQFVIEGEKMLAEARASDFKIVAEYRIEDIGENVMSRICNSTTPPPVLAVVSSSLYDNSDCRPRPDQLCLALDGVRDPGNMGTIIRAADWFGIKDIYASEDSVEFFNPKVVAASMGSIFRVRCHYCDISKLCDDYNTQGLPVYGTMLDGEDIYKSELSQKGLIVMGNESEGISATVAGKISRKLLIPSFGGSRAESLNVAVATAISLSEFRRR